MSILSGKGKIKLDGQKGLTKDKPILSIEAPDVVYIPLVLGTATDFDVHVKEGDHVCIGTKLATRKSMYVPIYSSVSGTVKGIENVCMLQKDYSSISSLKMTIRTKE